MNAGIRKGKNQHGAVREENSLMPGKSSLCVACSLCKQRLFCDPCKAIHLRYTLNI